ncbi:MAG: FAD-dependent oxidoreductase, partial [Gemmatimonadota bacterium]|nr:FAD-dependent oxidoreductase [Gemmatimonadota bacterium]
MPAESVAIIGAGIAGLGAAWTLDGSHDVHLFERDDRLGGHTHTVPVESVAGERLNVDTGFIVYNETTYPLLTRLLDRLGIETQPTNMSFSLECARCGVVYSGLGPWGVFADPRNVLRPAFLRFLWRVGRFNRRGLGASPGGRDDGGTLAGYLERAGLDGAVARHYALPLASALWSTGIPDVRDLPFRTFDAFFRSHRLYRIRGRLEWRTVKGGSRAYVDGMREAMSATVRTGAAAASVRREGRQVRLSLDDGSSEA